MSGAVCGEGDHLSQHDVRFALHASSLFALAMLLFPVPSLAADCSNSAVAYAMTQSALARLVASLETPGAAAQRRPAALAMRAILADISSVEQPCPSFSVLELLALACPCVLEKEHPSVSCTQTAKAFKTFYHLLPGTLFGKTECRVVSGTLFGTHVARNRGWKAHNILVSKWSFVDERTQDTKSAR